MDGRYGQKINHTYDGQVVAETMTAASPWRSIREDNGREETTSARHKSWSNAPRLWRSRMTLNRSRPAPYDTTKQAGNTARWKKNNKCGGKRETDGRTRASSYQCCHGWRRETRSGNCSGSRDSGGRRWTDADRPDRANDYFRHNFCFHPIILYYFVVYGTPLTDNPAAAPQQPIAESNDVAPDGIKIRK